MKRSDLIDRQAAIDAVNSLTYPSSLVDVKRKLVDLPSVQKKGKWVMKEDPYGFFGEIPVCSECGCTNTMREKYTYCPHCGAYMRDEIGEFNEKGTFAQLFDE